MDKIVSYELAKKLKEAKFYDFTKGSYDKYGLYVPVVSSTNIKTDMISAPTLYNCQKWIREHFNYDIVITPIPSMATTSMVAYSYEIFKDSDGVTFHFNYESNDTYSSYDEATDYALIEALKMI